MTFQALINDYLSQLDCTAKELSVVSGISAPVISRYRRGIQSPEPDGEQWQKLVAGIAVLARERGMEGITRTAVETAFRDALIAQSAVTMYSDLPMTEMSRDSQFPKKWMYGMAMMLKKGLRLNMIHNVDRPFHEMMLGLESFIPMYMTGQISPYYLSGMQTSAFRHMLWVSGAAALQGDCICGHIGDGRMYLTNQKTDVAHYQKRAGQLLKRALPLMEIYRDFMEPEAYLQQYAQQMLNAPVTPVAKAALPSLFGQNLQAERAALLSYFQSHCININVRIEVANLVCDALLMKFSARLGNRNVVVLAGADWRGVEYYDANRGFSSVQNPFSNLFSNAGTEKPKNAFEFFMKGGILGQMQRNRKAAAQQVPRQAQQRAQTSGPHPSGPRQRIRKDRGRHPMGQQAALSDAGSRQK